MNKTVGEPVFTKEENEILARIAKRLSWLANQQGISYEDIQQEVNIAGYENLNLRGTKDWQKLFYTACFRKASNQLYRSLTLPLHINKILKQTKLTEEGALERLAIKLLRNSTTQKWLLSKAIRLHNKHGGELSDIIKNLALQESKSIISWIYNTNMLLELPCE